MRASSMLALASSALASPILYPRASISVTQLSTLNLFAQYSSIAYCTDASSVGKVVSCAGNYCADIVSNNGTVIATFDGPTTDQQGFVAIDPAAATIVVSFRGSGSLRTWLTDAAFNLVDCSFVDGCQIHDGFQQAWGEISTNVEGVVAFAKSLYPSFRVVATGHSLGGAIATIAAASLRQSGLAVDLYTFGSPRVGNAAFADFVTNQTGAEFRVTHVNDLVPRLPPLVLNYRHTSPEYWLSDGNATTVTYGVNDIKICVGDANTGCNGEDLLFSIEAHLYYLLPIASCSGTKRAVSDLNDEELEARLNNWAELDRQLSAQLGQATPQS